MADHFLTKSRIDLAQCLGYGEGLALEAYTELHELLMDRAGEEAARLFAEPLLSRGNDTAPASVSWYTDIEGGGQPFDRLGEDAQAALSETLSRALEPVRTLLDDATHGDLVSAALSVTDPTDIWSVGGRPVIINWGMLPEGMAADAPARKAHYDKTLGRFLPLGAAAAAVTAGTVAATTAAAARPAASTAAHATSDEGETTTMSQTPPPSTRRVPVYAWLPLLLLLLLAGGTLAWLLMPGSRVFPEAAEGRAITNEAALAAARGVNTALEERLRSLQSSLDGAVCTDDGTLRMPDGRTIEGLLPPDPSDPDDKPGAVREAAPRSVLPPDPDRVQVPDTVNPKDTASLIDHIEKRTAIILSPTGSGMHTGTGFFVGPDLVVTNHHVVSNPGTTGIYVTNKELGQVHQAQVLKTLGPLESSGGDFALLRVPGVDQPAFNVHRSDASLKLLSVIAAGYPGDILSSDDQFQQLRGGNMQAVPDLAVTDGTISTEQNFSASTRVLVHSAPISSGNSGGPLIDMCGRLVGVNTFVRRGAMRTLNFALASADLMAFLANTDALPKVVTEACSPQVQRPVAPRSAALDQPEAGTDTDDLPKLPLPKLKAQ